MATIVETAPALLRRLLIAGVCAAGASALCSAARADGGAPAPLFSSNEPVSLTLAMPVRKLVSRKRSRPEVDGTLSYTGADGRRTSLDVEVSTRGHSRLELCSFPPLKLNLKRKQVKETLFAGQNKLKLVTACMSGSRAEQYLTLEYLIYRLYGEVTPLSFRVRPVRMEYVDTGRKNRSETGPGFLIEAIDGVAERTGMRVVERPEIDTADLEPEQFALLSVFQYMIGNTDWSAIAAEADDDECCHNASLLGSPDQSGALIAVPYDFDQAGLIDAYYALPARRLPIRSVRDRLYRGACSGNEYLESVAARFDAARPVIEAFFATEDLGDRYRDRAMDYLADSYDILDDPERRHEEIVTHCR
jgi:hypothetical protein